MQATQADTSELTGPNDTSFDWSSKRLCLWLQATQADTGELTGSGDTSREAAERGIACQLLSVLYDGSPLVRAELAAALARLAASHSVLFQV